MSEPGVMVRGIRLGTRWAALVLLLGLAACDDQPTAPSPPPRVVVEGTWTGTITDRAAGAGQLSMTLSGIETLGLGTFALTFADSTANAGGIVQARTQDAPTIEVILFFQTGGRDCSGSPGISYVARLALSQNRLTGTYSPAVACPLLGGGSMELTRP